MNATPATLVECEADRVDIRTLRADVNVAATFDVTQYTPQDDIFEILGVGNEFGHDYPESSEDGAAFDRKLGVQPVAANEHGVIRIHHLEDQ